MPLRLCAQTMAWSGEGPLGWVRVMLGEGMYMWFQTYVLLLVYASWCVDEFLAFPTKASDIYDFTGTTT